MTLTVEECRKVLSSDAARVLVEAPAGCGKTYEAVGLACVMTRSLKPHEQVLLLTHTNAAKNEFDRRSGDRAGGSRVRISTLDAFFLDVCTPYTSALGLPNPIKAGLAAGTVSFESLAEKALELLRRAPSVAQLIGLRFPFIILDEHQDASISQDACVAAIAAVSGARVRFFGDTMQAIYGFAGEAVSFTDLAKTVDEKCELSTPWRWHNNEELGAWILEARAALSVMKPLPIAAAPKSVVVDRVGNLPDPGYSRHYDVALLTIVRRFGMQSHAAVLTRTNRHAETLEQQTAGMYTVNEGSDFQIARDYLRDIAALAGQKKNIAQRFIALIAKTSIGFDAAKREQVLVGLTPDKLIIGRKKQVEPLLRAAELIYEKPTIAAACAAVNIIINKPPKWIKRFTKPRNLRLIASFGVSAEIFDVDLEPAIAYERQLQGEGHRTVGTIHKAKGLEYPNVLVWNFSDAEFPMTEEIAHLAYVAISRATESLTIVAPGGALSPWL